MVLLLLLLVVYPSLKTVLQLNQYSSPNSVTSVFSPQREALGVV